MKIRAMFCFAAVGLLAIAAGVARAQPARITASNVTLNPGAATIIDQPTGTPIPLATADIVVSSGRTLTVNGRHTIRSLEVQSGGVVTHDAGFTFDYSGGAGTDVVNGLWLNVQANPVGVGGNVDVLGGGAIDVSRRGFGPGQGPGAGQWVQGNTACGSSGAGHGGAGGASNCQPGGGAYGSLTQPTTMGSGGGRYLNGTSLAGSGGGVIRLSVAGTLTIHGSLIANGGTATDQGAGAGGSIWIDAAEVVGTGSITANGGQAASPGAEWGSGGGGRIAVYACNLAIPTSSISVRPGLSGRSGGNGTIYLDPDAMFVQSQPATNTQICRASANQGFNLQFDVDGATSFQWLRNGVPLTDGPTGTGSTIVGATTSTLNIQNAGDADGAVYTCVATSPCGSIESSPAATAVCRTDFECDGTVNDDDLGEFITAYFEVAPGPGGYAPAEGCPGADAPYDVAGYRADITGDCSLNDDDLSLYITLYFAGCE